MRFFLISGFILFMCQVLILGQSRADLEEQRKKTIEEIEYVDGMLKSTARERDQGLQSLRIIGNKVSLRESVLRGMNEEIQLLNHRISLNKLATDMMEEDLQTLKDDYSRSVVNSYRMSKANPDIVYILSARDFNQGYKRVRYLQQVTRYRRNESEIIKELMQEIKVTKERLEKDLEKVSDLQKRENQQKTLLQNEQRRQQRMVQSLGNKEKQLRKELEDKKRIARRIESEIARIVEEERQKALKSDLSPEQRLIGNNFQDNKGRLPWPVEKGIITARFGIHQHPVLKYVTEENKGIEITSKGKVVARSVFKGEVSAISVIAGANITVIIRHGNYLTVYSNLINVKVRKGDKVDTGQDVGEVYPDPQGDNNAVLKFMIFEDKTAMDPEKWIVNRQ
ncbi:MAG: peptidoglycan DD-metalloendopeptidase family protein [Bacteroidales bacterium]|nr:peptidoglycan DD-metalloendopeptidase family protein [Bacteroidales bacterium]